MAGEIAHIVYAARLLTHMKDNVSYPSYWVGTVFPDIYRIGRISRFPTHIRPVSLSALVGNNDFTTGVRVHSWVDATHELYFKEHAIFEKLPWHPLLPFAFELFEDEVLYDSYEDWHLIIRALATVDPDEERMIHNRPHIQAWHALLQTYFRSAPSDESRLAYMEKLQLSSHSAKEINSIVSDLREHTTAKEILMNYIQTIEHILI
ncbi:MAG TPA: hypothetical protein VJI96_01325 [Candidatus Andersenbacteria bacterium]|nr:hypothetical protein [Candidatus Andersenbacteria bacterium]